ncbi:hypothetical protein BOTNAR_0439g00120 [Botryotinia narcissicola]|uniref:DUF1275 domain protein n=1 Tax=Botryotinia narcissicola TaxID=278944 RepID=A0A4Z1HJI6_9HELO|nr:hypothetical protein BOTNAR_0439g00120 [Botryotinia narcissicola]
MVKAPSIEESGPAAQSSLPTTELPSPSRSHNASMKESHDSLWARTKSHFSEEITLVHADLPMIACALVSGICDSSAYNAWTCFVSMQTGNTIFLALGASGQPISHPYAAALVQRNVVPEPLGVKSIEDEVNFIELIPLAFLAFQSGGQIVTSRILGFNEIPTTVLTSVYCDIASDPKVLARNNVKRSRRVGAVLAILSGGIAGGWINRSSAGLSAALWLAAAIKVAISFSWAIWKPKPVTLA